MREAVSMPTGDTLDFFTRPKLRADPATRGGQLMNRTRVDEPFTCTQGP